MVMGSAVLGAFPAAPIGIRATMPRSRGRRITMATSQTVGEVESQASEPVEEIKDGQAKIYVGKGRFIVDDPSKYPDRTSLTGGFAGGEVGLKQFVAAQSGAPAASKKKESQSKASGSSKGGIYVGKGKFVPYDPKENESEVMKSTGRDSSLVGGFAGGEVGLRQYVDTGSVPFAPEGSRRKQQSPLIVAGIVSVAAVTGGVLLSDVSDVGEQIVSGSTSVSPAVLSGLDENTKLLLETAVLLVGVVGTLVGGRAIVGSLTSSIKEGATRLAVLASFWVVVFIAARFILDSP